ncbi:lipocalin family protein [Mucilaginibacter daejeonensis]|uniref:lipocalin family protein n=1 Tax=Mucilaginibacter daejeonensis TaxID=398049 RepID=UPI001D179CD8|nr:lipocalin family protein [Mucilaginibacter daejeonensis]UEG51928.1 lipocalin family protein [Mucilaginibacter daejeonensis]
MNNIRKNLYYAGAAGLVITLIGVGISSCVSIPKGAKAVRPFNRSKYLGKWYEIARMDFKFEKGLQQVTAEYSLKDENVIKVVNRGFDPKKQEWKESVGKAKLVGDSDDARLKVSFFGPFYAGYNVIEIDLEYRYAMVAGNNTKYLWLLSREPTMPKEVIDRYLEQAKTLGFKTEELVWTKQDK